MLKVGVHENVVINHNKKNDRGSLLIGFKKLVEKDPLAMLNSGDASSDFNQDEYDALIFSPTVEAYGGGEDTIENILKKIAEVKDPLTHILLQYMPKSSISWDNFAGTGVDGDNMKTKLKDQGVLDQIYQNIINRYMSMMEPHVGESGKLFRLLLIRQSKTKHYPAIRRRWLDGNPFMESMEVPAEASKLKFTDYEIKNGLNNGEPIEGADKPSSEEASAVEALLNR